MESQQRVTSPGEFSASHGSTTRLRRFAETAGIVGLLVWCLIASVANLRNASRPRHSIADLETEFASLIPHLPGHGEIGFLERYEDPGSEDAARTWYTAQYALSPRVVVSRLGPQFLIVARGAAHPDGDPRLDGYMHVHTVAGGHQLFRRLP